MPFKFETGTPLGTGGGDAEAVDFIADIGKMHEDFFTEGLKGLSGRRRNIVAGMMAIDAYEEPMAKKLRTELGIIKGLKIYGPPEGHARTSTVSFTVDGVNANEIGKFLGENGIFVWDGDFYAIEIINNVLNLEAEGGLVRIGLAPYNTEEEINRTIKLIKQFCETKQKVK